MLFWRSNKHRHILWASKRGKNTCRNFNEHFINIAEKSIGTKPSSLWDSGNSLLDEATIEKIVNTYQSHPSVLAIKSFVTQNSKLQLVYF